jgi:sugar lactone lactonase YvrE
LAILLTVAFIGLASTTAGASDEMVSVGPQGIAVDKSGNVYTADARAHVIRKLTADGTVSILAGLPGQSGSDDGRGGNATFNAPASVAVDSKGNVFVADGDNHTIRKITPGGFVTTLAGQVGSAGSTDGPCATASFNYPLGMAVDPEGNIYVADMGNSTVRKISPDCQVNTLAGKAGTYGTVDGQGSVARFMFPQDIAADGMGNVYVAELNSQTIRKIAPNGVVSTFAGSPGQIGHQDGTGSAARFNFPKGIAADAAGNVLVLDSDNRSVRMITPAGSVSTLSIATTSLPAGLAISGTTIYVTLHGGDMVTQDVPRSAAGCAVALQIAGI